MKKNGMENCKWKKLKKCRVSKKKERRILRDSISVKITNTSRTDFQRETALPIESAVVSEEEKQNSTQIAGR